LIPAWQPLDKTPPRPVQVASKKRPAPLPAAAKGKKLEIGKPFRRSR